MKIKISASVDDYLIKSARDKGLNVSEVLNKALMEKTNPKINDAPKETLRVECAKCGKFTDKGYFCRESKKAWCVDCHKELNISKSCAQYHRQYSPGEFLHFHTPFGNVEIDNFGQTLEDIEKGDAPHIIT